MKLSYFLYKNKTNIRNSIWIFAATIILWLVTIIVLVVFSTKLSGGQTGLQNPEKYSAIFIVLIITSSLVSLISICSNIIVGISAITTESYNDTNMDLIEIKTLKILGIICLCFFGSIIFCIAINSVANNLINKIEEAGFKLEEL